MSSSPNYRSPTKSSSSKIRPPIRLEQRVVQLNEAVEDLREDLAQEVAITEHLEKLSEKYQQDSTVKLNALRQNFDSFSQQMLVRLENVRTEMFNELSKEVRGLTATAEASRKLISEQQKNHDDLERRFERQTKQVLTQETLGERLTRDLDEVHKLLSQVLSSQEVQKNQATDQAARHQDLHQFVKQLETRVHLHEAETSRLHEDTAHCLKFLATLRDETAALNQELTEGMRELRSQAQAVKWKQEDDIRATDSKFQDCLSAISRLERGHADISDGVSELQGNIEELHEVVRRRTVGSEQVLRSVDASASANQRLRTVELEMESLKRETQTRLLELEGSLLRRSRY